MTTTQVNDTIISLLEAKGVHPSVGRAFCMGLDKSGKFQEVREIVCGIYKKKIFQPRTQADVDNPSRLYATRRRVLSREGKAKFYPPYKMSRHEILLFSARYPEVEVIHKSSRHDNPHAFHANSRHVSTEILLGYVREHALIHDYDYNSVIDVGGNEAYHAGRERVVHCDTPVLSARDKARYTLREVYSGSSSSNRCFKTFGECLQTAHFGIAVHSTYDMTPMGIAKGMHRRGIKAFFGVIVIPSNLKHLVDGDHSCDGTNITLSGDNVTFTFPYDSSVAYTHSRVDLLAYLRTRDTIPLPGVSATYGYRIISMRGDTIFFSVVPIENFERTIGPSTSVVPPMGKYYISIPSLTPRPLEVEAQPFDRMVMHAAGARNFETYDIVALYQYAKSVRASLTINSIVLSHGYGASPSDIVTMVIAAYCVAASFKIESSNFFKRVTTQVDSVRRSGLFSSLFQVTSRGLIYIVSPLFAATGAPLLFNMTDSALRALVSSAPHVDISVSPSQPTEVPVVDNALAMTRMVETHNINRPTPQLQLIPPAMGLPQPVFISEQVKFPSIPMDHGDPRILVSAACDDNSQYGTESSLPPTPVSDFAKFVSLDIEPFHKFQGGLDAYSTLCNEAFIKKFSFVGSAQVAFQPVTVTPHRDFVFTTRNSRRTFVVRGVGRFVAPVSLPRCYPKRGKVTMCVRYDYDITLPLNAVINDEPTFEYGADDVKLARHLAGGGRVLSSSDTAGSDRGESTTAVPSDTVASAPSFSFSSSVPTVSSPRTRARPSTRAAFQPTVHSPSSDWADVSDDSVSVMGPLSSSSEDLNPFSQLVPQVGSESAPSVDSVSAQLETLTLTASPGDNAVAELRFMNGVFRRAVLSTCTSFLDLAQAASHNADARATWSALSKATPSEPVIVEKRDSKLYDVLAKQFINHGGVCYEGSVVPTREFLRSASEGDTCVTCEDLRVFVVDGIDSCIDKYKGVSHSCDVVLKDAPAANGKTYAITHDATVSDYAVCETTAALAELKDNLVSRNAAFSSRCFTADSVLANDRVVDSVDRLFVDEALRLHAGKIYLLMRMLKPRLVICYGDSEQIESISFQEGYDFVYNKFPFTSVDVDSTSRTMLPCFAMALSTDKYYSRQIVTHSTLDVLPASSVLDFAALKAKAEGKGVMVLTYTQGAKRDYKNLGISNVITIGESQGKRYDHVILVRDSSLKKVLYAEPSQALVAVTRCRYSFEYISASVVDDSAVARLLVYISEHHSLISDHIIRP